MGQRKPFYYFSFGYIVLAFWAGYLYVSACLILLTFEGSGEVIGCDILFSTKAGSIISTSVELGPDNLCFFVCPVTS